MSLSKKKNRIMKGVITGQITPWSPNNREESSFQSMYDQEDKQITNNNTFRQYSQQFKPGDAYNYTAQDKDVVATNRTKLFHNNHNNTNNNNPTTEVYSRHIEEYENSFKETKKSASQ